MRFEILLWLSVRQHFGTFRNRAQASKVQSRFQVSVVLRHMNGTIILYLTENYIRLTRLLAFSFEDFLK